MNDDHSETFPWICLSLYFIIIYSTITTNIFFLIMKSPKIKLNNSVMLLFLYYSLVKGFCKEFTQVCAYS